MKQPKQVYTRMDEQPEKIKEMIGIKTPSGRILTKDDLKTGDILFCTADRLLSRLIKKFTKSRYSHTAAVVKDFGVVLIVESQRRGVNILTYDAWQDKYGYKFDAARLTVLKNKDSFSKRAFSKTGVAKYDLRMLFWDYPRYVFTGKWRGDDEKKAITDNKYTCSTYIGWLLYFENWYKMSPQDVYEECQKSPQFDFL